MNVSNLIIFLDGILLFFVWCFFSWSFKNKFFRRKLKKYILFSFPLVFAINFIGFLIFLDFNSTYVFTYNDLVIFIDSFFLFGVWYFFFLMEKNSILKKYFINIIFK